ncbi:MAG TPA: prolyl oligopeptidase family serine peptidase, partial [Steroidobacter sp.]|nr:prolyl oligopeptidase family serine peptidase [Steroidobacter sp.]
MKQILLLASFFLSVLVAHADSLHAPAGARSLTYPATARGGQVDVYHGRSVADPYRWLENESAAETRQWIEAQNALAQPYLEAVPARERIKKRMTELWNHERYEIPVKRGGRYFYLRNDGLQNQNVLYVAHSLGAAPRVLLDPNTLSKDATVALGEFEPSPDGKLLAYGLSDGGTDWREWRIRDVETGRDLPDVLKFLKFAPVAWTADSRSLYYARYPLRADGSGDDTKQREVYRHVLGRPTVEDSLIYRVTDHPTRNPYVQVTDDGRYLIMWMYDGSQQTGVYYRKLDKHGAVAEEVVRLLDAFDANYEFIAEIDDVFYIYTTKDAPNGRVLAARVDSRGKPAWRTIVPESRFALIEASIVGGKLFTQYLEDARSVVRAFDLQGKLLYDVKLPGLGQAAGFRGAFADDETFFSYTDFLTPASISRLETPSGRTSVFRAPEFPADRGGYVTEQVFYSSKDGTRVPMFIVHRRDFVKDGRAPLMLYGYGGFNIPQLPTFSVPVFVWLEMGGVYAVANLRGGSEYGEAWHSAGTKLRKQNVFDDFIAAAEYLIAQKYTSTPKLAIRGRSNGGLLVGAALTQRPDLYRAVLCGFPDVDILRFNQYTRANNMPALLEYGDAAVKAQFDAIRLYSPYQQIRAGTAYPAVLVSSGDLDTRVPPLAARKFTARLQAASSSGRPVILRYHPKAGHAANRGLPFSRRIQDTAAEVAFMMRELGLPLPAAH